MHAIRTRRAHVAIALALLLAAATGFVLAEVRSASGWYLVAGAIVTSLATLQAIRPGAGIRRPGRPLVDAPAAPTSATPTDTETQDPPAETLYVPDWDAADVAAPDPLLALELPPEEPGPFAPLVLLLDTSSSMSGRPIDQLNEGIDRFASEVQNDSLARNRADICVIEFNSKASEVTPPTLGRDFMAPRLTANGLTAMGGAIRMGLETIKARRAEYRDIGARAYKPMMFLFTDGLPTDDWQGPAAEAKRLTEEGKLNFLCVGTGDADFATLAQMSSLPPMKLKGDSLIEMFKWISDSVSSVSGSIPGKNVSLPPTEGWGEVAF